MAVTMIMIGCGSDDKPADKPVDQTPDQSAAPPAAFSQDTPRETLKAFFSSFEDGDKEKFQTVISGDVQEVVLWNCILDTTAAYIEFERAAIAEYGAQAWQNTGQKTGSMLKHPIYRETLQILDFAEIKIDGDRAACTLLEVQETFNLTRKEGKWYLDTTNFVVNDPQANAKMKESTTKILEVIRQVQKMIGQPQVTPKSLAEELDQKITAVVFDKINP